MEPINTPAPSPAPVSTPVATPTPTPAPEPMVAQPMVQSGAMPSTMESGGATDDGSVKSFLKNVNWLEVIITSLGLTALIYTIHYYRFKSKEDKMVNNELQRQIDELKLNLQSALKNKYKSI
jgi:hypothetical protein